MEIHQVHGKQGLQWILSGFYLFRKAPLAWVFVCFTLMLIAMAMSFIPLLGKFVFTLISPAFLAGIMLGCKDMEQGKPIELKHLFIAFKTNPAPLITIGGIYLIGQILIIGLVMLIGGSQMTDMLLYEKRVDESELMGVMSSMLTSSLIALTLSIPLMMASWFSPLLVIFHNVPPVAAMQRSFFACLKNFIPFQLYGVTLIVLTVLSLIPYGLGLVILIPTIFTSIYVSYKDIFLAEPLRFNNGLSESDNQKTSWADADESSTKENETKAESNNTENKTLKLSETVPCAQCNLSVPRNEAIEDQEKFFCSEEHRQQYQATNKPGK
ncbi:BPSS1780 family membrane protein [Nitrosomonas sp.]|uniref:BPSS1780 family membrane protein n=1 Tax=Nitrosomonas sp. TaxID=42353 RepID=UPI0027311228|nr:BPSS1780 family membrane protein [Nitrosomonas sp.]MDP1788213.1 BPSS1780 family membrane protein [Nitrosomonas sp.]